ncbi:MAG: hypothetical protein HOO96_24370 [Polyangiaceae bacterium]|nr:hypothetical protein [Polyangiaceae bacterium]
MQRLGRVPFALVAVLSLAAGSGLSLAACSSSSTTPLSDAGTTPDTGTTPDGSTPEDGATCGKLPAAGPSQLVAPRTDASELGARAAMTLDRKGRPVFAYLDVRDANPVDLYVLTWDDCAGAWRAPHKIDSAIQNTDERTLSISVDPSDGRVGIGYHKIVQLVGAPRVNATVATFVAVSSDDGLNFASTRVSKHKCETDNSTEGDINNVSNVRIALDAGKTYVAYNQDYSACGADRCYAGVIFGAGNAAGTGFALESISDGVNAEAGGHAIARLGFGIGLAVDSDGKPAVAYHVDPFTGYNTTLAFWRPGSTTSAKITDSNSVQNDDGGVSLAFDGKKPRVVSRIQRGAIGAVAEYDLVFSASEDGITWAAPVALPRPEAIAHSQQILVSGGKVIVAAGGPHVFRSSDLTTFTVSDLGLAQGAIAVTGAVDKGGKLWLGIEGTAPVVPSALGGVVLHREQ